MSSAPTAEQIAADATWLAQALDPAKGIVRLVAMNRESYRAASFLDDRMLQTPVDAQILAWSVIEQATSEDLRSDARWIFHIGHVGSTLVSRLLGEIEGVLAIREPRLLRDLAIAPPKVGEHYLGPVPKLLSRTFDNREIACVKATSFASEIAHRLVPAGERAIFIYANPRNYIASILAGENSVKEMRLLAASRAERSSGRVTGLDHPLPSNAHGAAAAWACEMTSLEQAAERMPDRHIDWVDFDRMLDDMADAMTRAAAHLQIAADASRIEAIVNGPLMRRYSKALEYDYSPSLRRELIDEARRNESSDIESALAMLETAAEKSPLLARALARAER